MTNESQKKETAYLISEFFYAAMTDKTNQLKNIFEIFSKDQLDQYSVSVDVKDAFGAAPLHYAALIGNEKAAKLLIDNGADVNIKDQLDMTPLHLAVQEDNKGIAKLLKNNGANVYAIDANGKTPVAIAFATANGDMAKILTSGKMCNANKKINKPKI